MTHHRITTTIALALVLAAAAPVAYANPAPLAHAEAATANTSSHSQPSTGPCSEVCSGDGYGSVKTTAADPTYTGPCSEVCSGDGYGPLTMPASTRALSGAAVPYGARPRSEVVSIGSATPNVPATVVHVVAPDGSFHWDDAGIGAGSILALTLLGLGGVFAATHHRGRQGQS